MNKKETKERSLELIREGKTYIQTKEVIEQEGGKIAGATYYRHKQETFPSEKMDAALEQSGEKRQKRAEEEKTTKRRVDWTPTKQKGADSSKLAE